MKFVSFNVNGLRARMHQLEEVIVQLNPDIIGLQETKVHDDFFPKKEITQYGYHVYCHGQKGHYGVALLSRQSAINVSYDFIHTKNDSVPYQTRIMMINIITSIGNLTVINAYCPQGENKNNLKKFSLKEKFYKNLRHHIKYTYNSNSLLLVMGDMNISPTDLDIGIGEQNKKKWIKSGKCSFLPEEQIWINQLMHCGLIDVYRNFHPKNNQRYSWFSYRANQFSKNYGLRIDFILTTRLLINYYKNSDISYNIRKMHRPSDHAPVWVDLDI